MNLAETWTASFAPPDRAPTSEWAGRNLIMPAVLSEGVGRPYDRTRSPHLNAPMDAADQLQVREINVLAPPRSAKTLILDIVGARKAAEGATVLTVAQIDAMAKTHAETRTMPMLLSCPPLRDLLPANADKIRTQDIIFGDGRPYVVTGPAMANLQSRPFKVVGCDEVWAYPPGRLYEAKARLGDFVKSDSSLFMAISQGGEPDSDWQLQQQSGVSHELAVPCLGTCGRYFFPRWTGKHPDGSRWGIVFDAGEGATHDEELAQRTVRFVCPYCGHEHPDSEATRQPWKARHRWVRTEDGPEGPDATLKPWPRNVSFRWNAIIDYPWRELVKEWLLAQRAKKVGNFVPLVKFIQKRLAEHANEFSCGQTDSGFTTFEMPPELQPGQKVHPDAVHRLLTVDRQADDLFWWQVRDWAKDGRSWRVGFGRAIGFPDVEEVRKKFGVTPRSTLVDSGYRPRGDTGVYAACARYGWFALKGDDVTHFTHYEKRGEKQVKILRPWAPVIHADPGEGTSSANRRLCPLFRFSAPTMARAVKALIRSGHWLEPATDGASEMEREYTIQMNAEFERWTTDRETGKRVVQFVCPSRNNHQFDCAKMQALGAMHLGCIPAGVEDLQEAGTA